MQCVSEVFSQTCSLPQHKREVDLNTLGNTLVENLLAESAYISHIDKTFGVMQPSEELTGHKEWQFDYEKNGVKVFKEKNKLSKLHSFASRGVITASYVSCYEFIKDPQSTFIWDSFLMEAKYLKTYARTSEYQDYLAYQLHSAAHCFSLIKRDMLYYVRCQYKNGKFIMAGISVDDDDYPPQKSLPRCEMHMGSGFVVEPFRGSKTSSLVTYLANGDMKGVPQFIATQVIRRHSVAIKYIQRSFEIQGSSEQTQACSSFTSFSETPHQSTLAYEEDLPMGSFMKKL